MLDGFITALAAGPGQCLPEDGEVLAFVVDWFLDPPPGPTSPAPAADAQRRAMIALIVRHWEAISDGLEFHPDDYRALVIEQGGDPVPGVLRWLVGYGLVIRDEPDAWVTLAEQHPEWLQVLTLPAESSIDPETTAQGLPDNAVITQTVRRIDRFCKEDFAASIRSAVRDDPLLALGCAEADRLREKQIKAKKKKIERMKARSRKRNR